jgi:hypothetical protein
LETSKKKKKKKKNIVQRGKLYTNNDLEGIRKDDLIYYKTSAKSART